MPDTQAGPKSGGRYVINDDGERVRVEAPTAMHRAPAPAPADNETTEPSVKRLPGTPGADASGGETPSISASAPQSSGNTKPRTNARKGK